MSPWSKVGGTHIRKRSHRKGGGTHNHDKKLKLSLPSNFVSFCFNFSNIKYFGNFSLLFYICEWLSRRLGSLCWRERPDGWAVEGSHLQGGGGLRDIQRKGFIHLNLLLNETTFIQIIRSWTFNCNLRLSRKQEILRLKTERVLWVSR